MAKEYTCSRCNEPKDRTAMSCRGAKVLAICRACYSKALTAGRGKQDDEAAPDEPADTDPMQRLSAFPKLEEPASLGFNACIHEGSLLIQQPNPDGSVDQVLLTRAEFQRIGQAFSGWATNR